MRLGDDVLRPETLVRHRSPPRRAWPDHKFGPDRFSGGWPLEKQEHRTSGLNLAIAAIACWDTIYLGRAVNRLRGQGVDVPEPLPPHISSLGWSHVALTGGHLWDSALTDPLRLRPLNEPSGQLDPAA
jgi:hypothetical protein